uniref:Secreted protein n=1 Tax=Oryza punctata TaxID=4537 RepID=A0A0E0LI35_ORYPU
MAIMYLVLQLPYCLMCFALVSGWVKQHLLELQTCKVQLRECCRMQGCCSYPLLKPRVASFHRCMKCRCLCNLNCFGVSPMHV